jgi:hypothetical protein
MLVVVGCVVYRVALSLYQCSLLGVVSAILGSSSIRLIHLPGCILGLIPKFARGRDVPN